MIERTRVLRRDIIIVTAMDMDMGIIMGATITIIITGLGADLEGGVTIVVLVGLGSVELGRWMM